MLDNLKKTISTSPNRELIKYHEVVTDALRAEITQLRAELAEQKADAMKWFGVALEQKHELEQERELADRLAEALGEMQVDYAYGDRQEYWINTYNARRNK